VRRSFTAFGNRAAAIVHLQLLINAALMKIDGVKTHVELSGDSFFVRPFTSDSRIWLFARG